MSTLFSIINNLIDKYTNFVTTNYTLFFTSIFSYIKGFEYTGLQYYQPLYSVQCTVCTVFTVCTVYSVQCIQCLQCVQWLEGIQCTLITIFPYLHTCKYIYYK